MGALRVSLSTNGVDFDLDGYTVQVDGVHTRTIHAFGTTIFSNLTAGSHRVELGGLAENCAATAETRLSVAVTKGRTSDAAFAVDCPGTGLEVSISATGLDIARWFSVLVDGVARGNVYPSSSHRVTRLRAGVHEVSLASVANCSVNGSNSLTVDVPAKQIIPISFAVTCVAATGSIEITTATTGIDQDLDGYTVQITEELTRRVTLNGTMTVNQVRPGDYVLRLGLASNCAATGGQERAVHVTAGGTTRDTVRLSFEVGCTRLWDLAFSRAGSGVALATADGEVIDLLDGGWGPAWSPDGTRLAYTCGGICIASLDGRSSAHLNEDGVVDLAWRPDGGRIALVRQICNGDIDDGYGCYLDGLFLIDPAGSNRLELTVPPTVAELSDLAWSPDGHQLGFSCRLSNRQDSDICVMNADGSGFRQLTSDAANDRSPAWKPDGSAIALHTDRYYVNEFGIEYFEIVVTGLDGASITRLSPGTWGAEPSWSPDGSKILFRGERGLFVMNAEGSGQRELTTGNDFNPVWRP